MKRARPTTWTPLIRALLIFAGLAFGAIGLYALVPAVPRISDKITFVAWFFTPAVLSDAALMPTIAVLGWAAGRWLPLWLRVPAVAGAILSAASLAIALPFLSKPGLRPDNPSLLDRNYLLGFALILALIWVIMSGWALLRRRQPAAASA
ncbi:MAG: hypothetical protein M3Y77_05575 [Actinomycetota bacterium]|nr:hypothetical protein [Actinomycetota bacterium]